MIVSQAIRTAIYNLLEGAVFYGMTPVAVYDAFSIPEGANYPYILLTSQSDSERLTKGRRPSDGDVMIEAVTGFKSPEGMELAEELMSQVNALVNPRDRSDFPVIGYELGDIRVSRSYNLTAKNDIYYVYRKIIIYSYIISDATGSQS